MKFNTVLLAIILLASSCSSQPSVDYADKLKGCLTDEDILLLNEACQVFDAQLINKYDGQELGKAYKSFLLDVDKMNLPPNFFVTNESKEIIDKMISSNIFDKIWAKPSSLKSNVLNDVGLQDDRQNVFEPFSINSNGDFFKCFNEKNTNKVIAEYLEAIKHGYMISPGVTASMLRDNLTSKDFDNGLTRLLITIGFYYEIGLMFKDM